MANFFLGVAVTILVASLIFGIKTGTFKFGKLLAALVVIGLAAVLIYGAYQETSGVACTTSWNVDWLGIDIPFCVIIPIVFLLLAVRYGGIILGLGLAGLAIYLGITFCYDLVMYLLNTMPLLGGIALIAAAGFLGVCLIGTFQK